MNLNLDLCEFDRDIDMNRFFLNSHMSFLSEMELASAEYLTRLEKHLR